MNVEEFVKEVDALVCAYATTLLLDKEIREKIFEKLVALVGEDQAAKLVGGRNE